MSDTISLRDHSLACDHDDPYCEHGAPYGESKHVWQCDLDGCPGGKERTYRQIRLVRMGGIDPAWYQAKPGDEPDEIVLVEVTDE